MACKDGTITEEFKHLKVENDEEFYKPLKDRKKVLKMTHHNIKA